MYKLTLLFDTTLPSCGTKRGTVICADKEELLGRIVNAAEGFNDPNEFDYAVGTLLINMKYVASLNFWIENYEVTDGHEKTTALTALEIGRLMAEAYNRCEARINAKVEGK